MQCDHCKETNKVRTYTIDDGDITTALLLCVKHAAPIERVRRQGAASGLSEESLLRLHRTL